MCPNQRADPTLATVDCGEMMGVGCQNLYGTHIHIHRDTRTQETTVPPIKRQAPDEMFTVTCFASQCNHVSSYMFCLR